MSGGQQQSKLEKFGALDAADKWMLLHATVWLALARIMLVFLPFRRLAERLSAKEQPTEPRPDPQLLRRIGYAVQAAAGNVPWRSDCFPQSIAGWMILRHHGCIGTVHLGVKRSGEEDLIGHAWLTCCDAVITGGEDLHRYAEIRRLGA